MIFYRCNMNITNKMKVIIDLDQSILDKVQKKADKEKRSRKQMIELIIEGSVEK